MLLPAKGNNFIRIFKRKEKRPSAGQRKNCRDNKIADFVALSHQCFDRARPGLDSRDHHAALENAVQEAHQRWVKSPTPPKR
jgi:hypothetical protein